MTDICSSQTSSITCSQQEPAKFIIPKKSKSQIYSLIDLEDEDQIEKKVIQDTLIKSNFDQTTRLNVYDQTELKRIEHKTLQEEFIRLLNAKKAQVEEQNKRFVNLKNNKSKVIERNLFYVVKTESEMMDIVKNGFNCKPSDEDDRNVLGPSQYGLHMSKHLDITLLYQYYLKLKFFFVIVVKTFYSAFRLSVPLPEKNKSSYPDPADGVEMSNQLPDKNQPIKVRYYNSLVYLFDEDKDSNITDKPRNMLAWAVIKYEQTANIEKHFINLYINPNSKDLKQKIKMKKQNNFKQAQKINKPIQPKSIQPQAPEPLRPFHTNQQRIFIPKNPPPQPKQFPSHESNFNNQPSNLQFVPTQLPPLLPNPPLPLLEPPPNEPIFDIITNIPIQTENTIEPDPPSITPLLPNYQKPKPTRQDDKPKKLLTFFGSENSESETESENSCSEDEENWAEFCYNYYMENYNDFVEELHVKPPRWRIIYERTGRIDFKFKSSRQLEVKLDDIGKTKLKYTDESKDCVNLKDPTNKLILLYQSKKLKNCSSNTNLITPVKSEPTTSQESKKIDRQKTLSEFSKKLAELKKKNETNDLIKNVKKEKIDPSTDTKKLKPTLSSEMTSLEKRLLAKSTLNKEPIVKNTENLKNTEVKKSGFWEPDLDSQFYLTRIRKEKCEPFQDVLILTRINLNKKITIEYSKQYYDANISLLDAEIEKFKRLNSGLIPTEDSLTKSKIESHIKVPLKATPEPQTKREKFMNKPKYVHHVKINNSLSEFQVDNLKKFSSLKDRVEIHSGGFNGLVLDAGKRKNCRIFDPMADLSEESQSSKRISISEYRVINKPIKVEPVIEPISIKSEPLSQSENETQHPDIPPVPVPVPIPPSPITNSNSLPVIKTEGITLPTLSLIDEVKKRVRQDNLSKSPLYDGSRHLKKRVKHKKKFKNKKKKIKKILNSSSTTSTESSLSSSSDSEILTKHKKSRYEDDEPYFDDDDDYDDNSIEIRHSKKHKHKHRHKKKTKTHESDHLPTYDFDDNPTYEFEDLIDPELKSELIDSPCQVKIERIDPMDEQIVDNSIRLPVDPVSKPPPPPPPPPPSQPELTPVKTNQPTDSIQRHYDNIKREPQISTPNNPPPKFTNFHTPINTQNKPAQNLSLSAPTFRFNKNQDPPSNNTSGIKTSNFQNLNLIQSQNGTNFSPNMQPNPHINNKISYNNFQTQNVINFNRLSTPVMTAKFNNQKSFNNNNNIKTNFSNNQPGPVYRFNKVNNHNKEVKREEGEDGEILDY
ncbi:unnamed protein product [Brachionus calyciflorus]|uniref:Uncharacterized protein n=1 Tax=Brachionus calyciflorus TaxID=104777 RepID=A0A813U2C4_9BILA|nr:unnamed protein product [Brachionus calyciflorus]